MATGIHGHMSPFNPANEDWRAYIERFELYCTANDLDDGKKKAVLLSVCGAKTYQMIRSLTKPDMPKDKSYDQIVSVLTSHYSPKPSKITQRYKFNTRYQGKDESIADYVAALREISEFCDYRNTLDDMLRDRLVCGVHNNAIQLRLLSETDLTFTKALQLATSIESADHDSKVLANKQEGSVSVHYHSGKKPATKKGSPQSKKIVCMRCGGNHLAPVCKFKEYKCRSCGKVGHLAKVCRSKQPAEHEKSIPTQKNASKMNYVSGGELSQSEDEDVKREDDSSYSLFTLSSSSATDPYSIDLNINNSSVSMELDTGASLSIISEDVFKSLSPRPPLEPTSVKLKTYSGESLEILGKVHVIVKYESNTYTLSVIVVIGSGPCLLGRDWLQELQLNWKKIFQIRSNDKLKELLHKYCHVFSKELGTYKGTEITIHVKPNTKPRFFKHRSVPYILKSKIETELQRLQSLGIITPVKSSDWAAPIVPVTKPDGSVRICGDYKLTINQAAHIESYPLPKIEDLLSALAGGVAFTKLDLAQAYLQLPLSDSSKQYVTVNTHKGLFEFNRVPFGITSAPAIFQRCMDTLFQGSNGVIVYIDDILVTGKTIEEHLQNLEEVLSKLSEVGLKLKQQKCIFLAPEVEYLGYTITKEGIKPSASKVQAIQEAKTPTGLTELRAFLGMLNYYAKFLPNLSTLLAPLYKLLQKRTAWQWNTAQQNAFKQAKELLQQNSLLIHFDDSKPIILACDASPYGIGAVLSHKMSDGSERPISFASRSLTSAEKRYSQLDKEALAIVFGVKKFHSYIYGRKFVICSDHKPLSYLLNETKPVPVMASARLQRWALTLSTYQYSIKYKPGHELANADALSRLPRPVTTFSDHLPGELIQLINYLVPAPVTAGQMERETEKDPILGQVKRYVSMGQFPNSDDLRLQPYIRRFQELSLMHGCLLWGSRLIVPPSSRKLLLDYLHDTHDGSSRMKGLARGYMWWPGMDSDIENIVKHCEICQKVQAKPASAPPHCWNWPSQPWTRLHLDFAGPFLGHMYLVLVDACTKWIDVSMMSSITADSTIDKLYHIFANFGLPRTIVSDNGPTFTSEKFKKFCQVNGIKHITSAPYHPQTNGLAERAVQTFKRSIVKIQGSSIQNRIQKFLFRYRITPHPVTNISPFEFLFNRKPRCQLDLMIPDVSSQVEKNQEAMLQKKKKQVRSFAIGDKVYVRDFSAKDTKWLPGQVSKITGPLSYHILLSNGKVIRQHVDNIRKRSISEKKETIPKETFLTTPYSPPSIPPPPPPPPPLRRSKRARRPPNRNDGTINY